MSNSEDNDNGRVCPRCNTNHCEEDNEFDNRLFWQSNIDNVEICRACVGKEAESKQKCDNCNCLLENVDIFVLTKGVKEQTWCSECVQTFWQDLKSEGWVADDGTWSELGFDDESE